MKKSSCAVRILIVAGVLLIVLALVAPSFFCYYGGGNHRSQSAKSMCDNFKNAILVYGLLNGGKLPGSLQDLVDGNYMSGGGVFDPWGTPYQLVVPGPDSKAFDVISYGADRKPGGTDINADISCWREME